MTSPDGGSTLMTSAPWSPRIIVAKGPDMFAVKSTTVIPASGPRPIPVSSESMPFIFACHQLRGYRLRTVSGALGGDRQWDRQRGMEAEVTLGAHVAELPPDHERLGRPARCYWTTIR